MHRVVLLKSVDYMSHSTSRVIASVYNLNLQNFIDDSYLLFYFSCNFSLAVVQLDSVLNGSS